MAYSHKDVAGLNTHLATRSYITGCVCTREGRGDWTAEAQKQQQHPIARLRWSLAAAAGWLCAPAQQRG